MHMFTDPEVILMPIDEVLNLESVDSDAYGLPEGSKVSEVLDMKRQDSWYSALLVKVLIEGMVTPLHCDEDREYLTDGHHRVACAVDLGYTHIPVIADGHCEYDKPDMWGAASFGWKGFTEAEQDDEFDW